MSHLVHMLVIKAIPLVVLEWPVNNQHTCPSFTTSSLLWVYISDKCNSDR